MIRRFEKGSVVGFVVVGIVLTAALLGGVWFARHPMGGSTKVADDTHSTSTQEERNSSDKSDGTPSTTDKELKDTLTQQSSHSSTAGSTSQTTGNGSSSAALPVTGPTDTLLEMLGATLLAGVLVAYVRSRSIS